MVMTEMVMVCDKGIEEENKSNCTWCWLVVYL